MPFYTFYKEEIPKSYEKRSESWKEYALQRRSQGASWRTINKDWSRVNQIARDSASKLKVKTKGPKAVVDIGNETLRLLRGHETTLSKAIQGIGKYETLEKVYTNARLENFANATRGIRARLTGVNELLGYRSDKKWSIDDLLKEYNNDNLSKEALSIAIEEYKSSDEYREKYESTKRNRRIAKKRKK